MSRTVPVLDVFAGCGGLSEGFLQGKNREIFDLALALDSNPPAHATHQLRCFFHQFSPGKAPKEYYQFLRGEIDLEVLYDKYPEEAKAAERTTLLGKLGEDGIPENELHKILSKAIGGHDNWVLIGGPPCQAYSIAGRARNKGVEGYVAAEDHRHYLYREYLKILHQHRPAVFVMENVKGLLNSKIDGRHIWHLMLEDLIDPSAALGEDPSHAGQGRKFDGYRIYSLSTRDRGLDIFGIPQLERDEYVVECESFSIPQTRHRVLLFGVRADIDFEPKHLKQGKGAIAAGRVLSDLPRLRSGLTEAEDTNANWLEQVQGIEDADWFKEYSGPPEVTKEILRVIAKEVTKPRAQRGGAYVPATRKKSPGYMPDWFKDPELQGFCNHETKSHMTSDLHRYMFASCYARTLGESIKLSHFPIDLLPDHENVKVNMKGELDSSDFVDRFTVQANDRPASTVVAHIAKDGHKFIHYDASQCRALTVREAARIQTFPDNYYFLGNKTEQYIQVGNAVPPLLSLQIAEIVADTLNRAGLLD